MLRDLPSPSFRDQPYDIVMTGTPSVAVTEEQQRPDVGTVNILDDIFGSAPPSPSDQTADNDRPAIEADSIPNDQHVTRREQHPSDVPRLRSTHVTNGYREGIAVSKERHLQEGFDEGYSLGAELGLQAGWCLGLLDGLVKAVSPIAAKNGAASVSLEGIELLDLLEKADGDLKVERLCGREWFGEDGVWMYDVPGQDKAEEEGVSFAEVAAAHPIVKEWVCKARELKAVLCREMPS